jgi:WhiB family redox-sensing transcriptional regulator
VNWKALGACKRHPEVDFFPDPKKGRWASHEARKVCDSCFVKGQCLDAALKHDEAGVWGGTTETDRKRIQARYVRRKALVKERPRV